ncbi:MAG: tetratricopeptide repeat protein [Anaerolineae bacterium]|nr:tetratricopeptide repeat protein [Anaerolineae bacterium]
MLDIYIPMDRRQALATGRNLPDRAHGAVLFVDVSGFTPLTQALTRELGPQRGAEELIRQLNLVYGALIADLHQYRGSVIGFSGDAITCWLDQDDGSRATSCAATMQASMTPFAQVTTPAGTVVSLSIKIAIVVGPVRRFLVGDPKVQVLEAIGGVTLVRMTAAEKTARPGEIIAGAEVVERLRHQLSITEWREGASGESFAVLSNVSQPIAADPWPRTLPLTEGIARRWILPAVYEYLSRGHEPFLAGISPAVALFIRFDGIDYDQDDAAGSKLDAYLRWVQGIATSYEGHLMDLTIGDKGSYLYVNFGALVAHEDDPVRAVAAALQIRDLPAELEKHVSDVRMGISRGQMRAGAIGGAARRTYGAMGNEVNVAARLMGKAQPGQILVSPRVAKAAASRYAFQELKAVSLKGLTEPVSLFSPLGRMVRSAQETIRGRSLAPMVGRADQREELADQLRGLLDHQVGKTVIIEGDTGIGKTRLATDLMERAQQAGVPVLLGEGESIEHQTPYRAWRDVLTAYFELEKVPRLAERQERVRDIVTRLIPDQIERLPLLNDVLGLELAETGLTASLDPELRKQSLFLLLAGLLQARTRERNLVLVLEDAHWMDSLSWELALYVARALVAFEEPLLLMLVSRKLDERSTGAQYATALQRMPTTKILPLTEFDLEETSQLIAARIDIPEGELPQAVTQLVHRWTGGNPFFIEEMVIAFIREGLIHLEGEGEQRRCVVGSDWDQATQSLPETVQGLVLAKVDRLASEEQMVLKIASVVGRSFAYSPLRHVLQQHLNIIEATVKGYLEALVRSGMCALETDKPEPSYLFRQMIIWDVVYQNLLFSQRCQIHRALAGWYELTYGGSPEQLAPYYPLLAHHYNRAEDTEQERLYAYRAAGQAAARFANVEATTYFSRALELTPQDDLAQRYDLLLAREKLHDLQGAREAQVEDLSALEDLADTMDDVHKKASVALRQANYAERTGAYLEAITVAQEAVRWASIVQDSDLQASGLAQLGLITRRQGDYEDAASWYQRALALLTADGSQTAERAVLLSDVLNGLGVVHRQQGNFSAAVECDQEALDLSRAWANRRGEALALNGLGSSAYYQRNLTAALTFHRRALKIRQTMGDLAGEGTSLYNLAITSLELGEYGLTRDYFLQALRIQQSTGNRWEEVNVWNGLGVLYQELGNLFKARDSLERGLALSREIGDEAGEAYILVNLGPLARDMGDLETAEARLKDGLALAEAQADRYLLSSFLSYLADVDLQMDRFEQAIERAEQALEIRRELDMPLRTTADLAILAAAHNGLGEHTQATNCTEQALALLDECGGEGPECPQRDYFICSQVLESVGQTDRACSALGAARRLVMERAEKIPEAELRRSFLEKVPLNQKILRTKHPAK